MNRILRSRGEVRAGTMCLGCLLALLIGFSLSSCKLLGTRAVSELDFSEESPGADLSVSAHFVGDADDAPGFFRTTLPDSGIVPVFVGVRNNGSRPLVIFSANGMQLDSGFNGFVLAVDGKRYLPIHPRDVVERILGARKTERYKRRGMWSVFMGTIIPPAGAYFIYGEIDVGRYYRPLFSRSLYPVLASGLCRPVELAAGEEKRGYLYFDAGGSAITDSLAGTDSRGRPRNVRVPFNGRHCELSVQPCVPFEAGDTLAGYDFQFAEGSLFMLRQTRGGKSELLRAPVRPDARSPFGLFATLAEVSSKSAAIGDVAVRGVTAAIGLNFKSKSKLLVAALGASPRVLAEKHFSRGIERVFLSDAGVFVQTDDGYCRLVSVDGARQIAYARLGAEVDDALLMGDRLLAFQRSRGLALFGASPENALEALGTRRLHEGRRHAVGFLDDKIVVLNRGGATEGDTIALFLKDGLQEINRMALPGHALRAVCGPSALLVQLEDGTVLKLVPAPLVSLEIAESAYVPFKARALACVNSGFIAIGDGGICISGSLGDCAPGRQGTLEISTTTVR